MVSVLAIDVGSSSVKAAVLSGSEPSGALVREAFPTRYDGVRAEVDARHILRAVSRAAHAAVAGNVGRPVEVVAISAMSPSWVAMDRRGEPLSPVVTHQDRRSVEEARGIEKAVGKARHLVVTGNRPVPGGISSTTAAWFARHQRSVIRRADLVGHVQTLLIRRLTGSRVADPSNASFMGLFRTTDPEAISGSRADGESGWEEGLVQLAGLKLSQLPSVLQADTVAGELDAGGARMLGLKRGTPVLTGLVDTSAALVLADARAGTMVNVAGSTDVLGVVSDLPYPGETHLTRALGVGGKWMSVCTLASAGSALVWAKSALFSDLTDETFFTLVAKLAKAKRPETGVRFDPHLAGSRVTVEQPTGAFSGLRLSTSREDLLVAVLESLSTASAARLDVLRAACSDPLKKNVLRTGGAGKAMSAVLYRRWKGKWRFTDIPEAGLLGLGSLAQGRPV